MSWQETPIWEEPLRPFPWLPVTQEKYCDQAMTDQAIDYLEKSRPDLLIRLVQNSFETPENFSEKLHMIIVALNEVSERGEIKMPGTYLGQIDLMFEVGRRFAKAYGWKKPFHKDGKLRVKEYELEGIPLAKNPEDEYPLLPFLEILKNTVGYGLTQELVDQILQEAYEKMPTCFYEIAEGIRRGIWPYSANEKVRIFIATEISRNTSKVNQDSSYACIREIDRRLRLLCNLWVYRD